MNAVNVNAARSIERHVLPTHNQRRVLHHRSSALPTGDVHGDTGTGEPRTYPNKHDPVPENGASMWATHPGVIRAADDPRLNYRIATDTWEKDPEREWGEHDDLHRAGVGGAALGTPALCKKIVRFFIYLFSVHQRSAVRPFSLLYRDPSSREPQDRPRRRKHSRKFAGSPGSHG